QPDPSSDQPGSIWPRIIERLEFANCPEGSRAEAWGEWYADHPDYMQRVLDRARPWLHLIVNELDQRDLPGELALLPIVESAYDPFAYSRENASGPWQFLSSTARDQGLIINDWYDGRRDFYASTGAALNYLTYLANRFDQDWLIAVAAYNAGQGRVQRLIRRNQARGLGTTWDQLSLPRETRAYVPKLKGLGCLLREPERWGFAWPTIEDQPRVERVELPNQTELVLAAPLSGVAIAEMVGLNAGLKRHLTPPDGPPALVVPLEDAARLRAAIPELLAAQAALPLVSLRTVTVQSGDTLSALAVRHNTTVSALRQANQLSSDRLSIDQILKLPGQFDAALPEADARYVAAYQELTTLQQQLLPSDRIMHRVRAGESLWVIARRYGVSVRDVQRMNAMGPNTLIRPGQRLTIETGRAMGATQTVSNYVVRQGDSLWTIARRQGVSMENLMRWNQLDANSILQIGQRLIIRGG
ncbi:MAG: LysM peptidoglycan-binding domain-containing protein, partial [Pseudomonadota bacterium]